MYNLKDFYGTYKGLIGECLFKLTRRYLILPKFFNKYRYLKIFEDKLSSEEKDFLEKYWFSIDALEFDYTKDPRKIVLFEIKTLNDFYYAKIHGLNRIPKLTESTCNIYKEALKTGFDVKIAIVWLKNDWNYEINIIDFDKKYYIIDKPKKYDAAHGYFSKEK